MLLDDIVPCAVKVGMIATEEVAAMNNRHKRMGYNAAQEFAKQLDAHFEQMMLSSQLDAADDYDEYESLNGDEED